MKTQFYSNRQPPRHTTPTPHTPPSHTHTRPTSIFQRRALFCDNSLAARRQRIVEVPDGFRFNGVPLLEKVLLVQLHRAMDTSPQLGNASFRLVFDLATANTHRENSHSHKDAHEHAHTRTQPNSPSTQTRAHTDTSTDTTHTRTQVKTHR